MYRFVALIWNHRDPRKSETASQLTLRLQSNPEWTCILEVAGLKVFHAGVRPGASESLVLPNRGGAILGKLFARPTCEHDSSSAAVIDHDDALRIVTTGGRRLIDAYWGRYVAIIHDAGAHRTFLLRDPAGAISCLLTSHKGVNVVCSDIEDCARLGIFRFTINWPFVAGIVCTRSLQTRDTGLLEVSEIQPGERVVFERDEISRSFLWHPFRVAQSDVIEDAREAALRLHAITRDCVHAWASCYPAIVHRLSGGLDSSIVASCLQDAPTRPRVVCLNYFGRGPQEDERQYARLVAARTRFPLIEQEQDPDKVRLERILEIARSERPRYYVYPVEHGLAEAALAGEHGAAAMFGGAGGDGLFYQNTASLAATDYLRNRGLSPGLLRVCLDAARIDRLSLWAVLREAIAADVADRSWSPMDEAGVGKTFIVQDAVEAVKRNPALVSPWMAEAAAIPHGKRWHAIAVSAPLPFYDALSRADDPENIYPLLSQPLIELCLRLPTYVLIAGGWDRAIARRAFAQSLPAEIVKRRTKGGSTMLGKLLFQKNITFIRELLLDGMLVRERLLDRKKLERQLRLGGVSSGYEYGEILIEHLCTEVWLRSWSASTAAAASVA